MQGRVGCQSRWSQNGVSRSVATGPHHRADVNAVQIKRAQTRRLFVMQGLATKGSKLGTGLCKREHELQRGRAEVPPEFNDPDLNEGWYEVGLCRNTAKREKS